MPTLIDTTKVPKKADKKIKKNKHKKKKKEESDCKDVSAEIGKTTLGSTCHSQILIADDNEFNLFTMPAVLKTQFNVMHVDTAC